MSSFLHGDAKTSTHHKNTLIWKVLSVLLAFMLTASLVPALALASTTADPEGESTAEEAVQDTSGVASEEGGAGDSGTEGGGADGIEAGEAEADEAEEGAEPEPGDAGGSTSGAAKEGSVLSGALRVVTAVLLDALAEDEPVVPLAGEFTVTFCLADGAIISSAPVDDDGLCSKPTDPIKLNLTFMGWFTEASGGEEFDFTEPVTEDLMLYARFAATVTFMVDGVPYGDPQVVVEGGLVEEPLVDPDKGEEYVFLGWRSYQYEGIFDFTTPIAAHLTLTAQFKRDPSYITSPFDGLKTDGYPATVSGVLTCCDPNVKLVKYGDGPGEKVELYFDEITEELVYVVVTCPVCGSQSRFTAESNGGIEYDEPGRRTQINLGNATLLDILVSVTFLPGEHGEVDNFEPWVIKAETPWDTDWVPVVTPDAGWTFSHWLGSDGIEYSYNDPGFPDPVEETITFTAIYSNKPVITITANTASKVYDGTPLEDSGYEVDGLPADCIIENVTISGSITNVGPAADNIFINSDDIVIKKKRQR